MKTRLLLAVLAFAVVAHADDVKPKYGPKDAARATPLSASNDYFRNKGNRAPDFYSLISFYVPQFNDYSCSAASVAAALNAARAKLPKTSEDKVITQEALLEKVNVERWRERLGDAGADGEHGTSLDRLGRVTEAAFKTFGFSKVQVKVVHVESTAGKTKKSLIRALKENEKSDRDFILANFNQQAFTDDADVGHIAPVGAYDSKRQRVLILDPDRGYYEPYWVSLDTFLSGMATQDKGAGAYRGYVRVKVGK